MSENETPVSPEQPTPPAPPPPPPPGPPAPPPYQPQVSYPQAPYPQAPYPQPTYPQAPYMPVAPVPGTGKPGQVTAIAILDLVDGIVNCLLGLGWMATLFGIPIGAYAIAVGIVEIVYATKILPDPIRTAVPARYVAVMQIINIISGNVVSLVAGILSLVFYNDMRVLQYFNSRRGQAW